jgi:protein-S-isoprenylcysteine O-methyltransferase
VHAYRQTNADAIPEPKAASAQKENLASSTTTITPKAALLQREDVKLKSDAFEESAMDALYARLNGKTVLAPRTPVSSTSSRPDQAKFSFSDRLGEAKADKIKTDNAEAEQAEAEKADNKKTDGDKLTVMTQEELESAYMRKASEYIQTLPDSNENAASLIKAMSRKLRSSYTPEVKIDVEKNDLIKARLAFAVANYINKILKKRPEQPRTPDSIKQTLKDADGDFLRLCAKLVEEGYVSLETLAEVSGIVATMRDVLPKAESSITGAIKAPHRATPPVASSAENSKPVSKTPVDNMKGWPTQEKRENRRSVSSRIKGLKLTNYSGCSSHLHVERSCRHHQHQPTASPGVGWQA